MQPLKESLFNKDTLSEIAKDLQKVDRTFNDDLFFKYIFTKNWDSLSLKQRVKHCTYALHDAFSTPFKYAVRKLISAAKLGNSFARIIYSEYIEEYGQEEVELSIYALPRVTIACTSEFAVRPFIKKYEKRMLKEAKEWAKSENEHVRRLASEGFRPRLPWGIKLQTFIDDPKPLLPILELLKKDDSLYVRKSVANCLNDVSKDNPVIFKHVITNWYGKHKHTDWICKHASRTLLKNADRDILAIFGQDKDIGKVTNFTCDKQVSIGSDLHFSFDLIAKGYVRVEYIIYYKRKTGIFRKVFKIGETDLDGKKHIFKKQSFKEITTRKHYLGIHEIAILINGVEKVRREFVVKK